MHSDWSDSIIEQVRVILLRYIIHDSAISGILKTLTFALSTMIYYRPITGGGVRHPITSDNMVCIVRSDHYFKNFRGGSLYKCIPCKRVVGAPKYWPHKDHKEDVQKISCENRGALMKKINFVCIDTLLYIFRFKHTYFCQGSLKYSTQKRGSFIFAQKGVFEKFNLKKWGLWKILKILGPPPIYLPVVSF